MEEPVATVASIRRVITPVIKINRAELAAGGLEFSLPIMAVAVLDWFLSSAAFIWRRLI